MFRLKLAARTQGGDLKLHIRLEISALSANVQFEVFRTLKIVNKVI
jgi:hypothetical protein